MKRLPWYLKILIGAAGATIIVLKTPIIEIGQLFIVVCLIPLALLASVGLVGQGVVEATGSNLQGGLDKFKESFVTKLNAHRENLAQKQPDTSIQ